MKVNSKLMFAILAAVCVQSVSATQVSNNENAQIKTAKATSPVETPTKDQASEEQSPLTGYLTLTSNYVFRGVSLSNNIPAVQGSLTYTFLTTGIYLNVWSSNTDLIAPDGAQATLEIDTIAGITNTIGDHFEYNFSVARYNYPKARMLEYNEILGTLSFYFLTASAAYTGNEYNVHKPGLYYNGGVKFDLPTTRKYFENMSLAATIGHFNLPKEAGNSYNDYSVTLSKDIKNYTLAVQWTDTNHKLLNNSLDDAHVIGTLTANF